MLITGKTLFTFVDPKDPFMPLPVAGEEQSGPVLSILSTRHFDFLFFFFTHTRSNAELTRQEVSHRYPECQVRLHEILVSDPKDYSALMGKLAREVRDIVRASRQRGQPRLRIEWNRRDAGSLVPPAQALGCKVSKSL